MVWSDPLSVNPTARQVATVLTGDLVTVVELPKNPDYVWKLKVLTKGGIGWINAIPGELTRVG